MDTTAIGRTIKCISTGVSKWECGEAVPDIDILDKIARIFNVTVSGK